MKRPSTHAARPSAAPEAGIPIQVRGHTLREAGELALQAQRAGNLAAAVEIYDRILVEHPGLADAHSNRGIVLHAMKRYAEALASFDTALTLRPGDGHAHNNRGAALQQLKRYPEALASYETSIALNPQFPNSHNNRGATLQHLQQYEEALSSCDQAIALKPDYASAHNNRGVALQHLKRFNEAQASFERAIDLNPVNAEFHNNLGLIWLIQGRMAEAEKCFRRALEIKPDYVAPWYNLSGLRKYESPDDPDIRGIETALKHSPLSPEDEEQLYFSLGKIYDDCSRYDEAFDAYQRANVLRNASVSYDAAAVTSLADSVVEVFNREFLAEPLPGASESRAPLFIVGMPRSGTTLLANIFSNHHLVATAGELPTITGFAQNLGGWTGAGFAYPAAAQHIGPDLARRLVNEYEHRLRRDAGSDARHVIDKYPLNFWHLGMITRLFPKARIIHCQRHPLDTGLSNYFQRFGLQYDYSFDLRHIGHYYQEYARLMEHWRQALPVKMIEIRYEDITSNTEPVVRQTLESLGFDWDERCLVPHQNRAPVDTASLWQVRQPVNAQSVGRWRHYERFLEPLKEVLLRAGMAEETFR